MRNKNNIVSLSHINDDSPCVLKGFTLIELLIVIAIISLLVSILLPSLQKAKELTQSVVCLSNQKLVGLAFCLYAENHNNRLPDYSDISLTPDYKTRWHVVIMPYFSTESSRDSRQYNCPSRKETIAKSSAYPGVEYVDYGVNYGFPTLAVFATRNYPGAPTPEGSLRISDIKNASNVFALMDSQPGHYNTTNYYSVVLIFTPWEPSAGATRPSYWGFEGSLGEDYDDDGVNDSSKKVLYGTVNGSPYNNAAFRHGGGNAINALFVDGHCHSVKKLDWVKPEPWCWK